MCYMYKMLLYDRCKVWRRYSPAYGITELPVKSHEHSDVSDVSTYMDEAIIFSLSCTIVYVFSNILVVQAVVKYNRELPMNVGS